MIDPSQYESELLGQYLRKGRVPVVGKADVDRALSIYKLPATLYAGRPVQKASQKASWTYANVRKLIGNQRTVSDSRVYTTAVHTVLTKAAADAAAAKKAAASTPAAAGSFGSSTKPPATTATVSAATGGYGYPGSPTPAVGSTNGAVHATQDAYVQFLNNMPKNRFAI